MSKWPAIAASIVIIGTLVAFALPKDAKYLVEPFESNLVEVGAKPSSFLRETATHWAEIDADGNVLRVIVADSDFIKSGKVGDPSTWVPTYEDNSKRGNYASKGFTYDKTNDEFIPPAPSSTDKFRYYDYTKSKWETTRPVIIKTSATST